MVYKINMFALKREENENKPDEDEFNSAFINEIIKEDNEE